MSSDPAPRADSPQSLDNVDQVQSRAVPVRIGQTTNRGLSSHSFDSSSTTNSYDNRTSMSSSSSGGGGGGDSPFQHRIGTAGLGIESRLNSMDLDMEPPIEPSSPLSPTTPLNGPWPGSHAATSQPAAESSLAAFALAVRTHGGGGHVSDVSTHLNAIRSASAPDSLHTGGEGDNKGVEVGRSNGEKEHEEEFPQPPIFSRRVSAPLPARIGHLRNPYTSPHGFGSSPTASSSQSSDGSLRPLPTYRIGDSNGIGTTTDTSRQPHQQSKALQTLSYELADSLQSAIQTLLQLSPPQLLDNAKEQYSGCTVQMPTTSFSALFTAMKGLNYLSANFKALCDVEIQEDDKSIANVHEGGSDCSLSTPLPCLIEEIDRKPTPSSLRRPASTHSLPPLPMPRGILDNALSQSEDFDIGELLQSTADLLGGQAAQSGVELVLFHGDVGIKHVSVKGDGEGLGYAVSVILRQILSTCKPGDCLELGLQLTPQSPSQTPRVNAPMSAADLQSSRPLSRSSDDEGGSGTGRTSPGKTMPSHHDATDGPLLCTFEIVHNLCSNKARSLAATPTAEMPLFAGRYGDRRRDEPDFNGLLCRRILKHVNASLRSGVIDESPQLVSRAENPLPRRSYELAILLARGQPIVEPAVLSAEEQAARQPFPSLCLAREPTLYELADFAESLRGKRVELHASLQSLFAGHLTNYLAAWGMDVSHFPIEDGEQEMLADSSNAEAKVSTARQDSRYGGSIGGRTPEKEGREPSRRPNLGIDLESISSDRIIIIDDDVNVLKKQLLKIRAESPDHNSRFKTGKRPGISIRAKSSPQIRQIQSSLNASKASQMTKPAGSVIIHFTSLANFNLVRDLVSGILAISPDSTFYLPEVTVIPKPVGPRRFLTALHTALDRPLVDPIFSPIATSPRSPGGGYFSLMPSRAPSAVDGVSASLFGAVPEESSEGEAGISSSDDVGKIQGKGTDGLSPGRSGLSPGSRFSEGRHLQINTPAGDIVATSAMEYFSDAVAKLGSAAASGLVVQSPDGRPVGMYFDPPPRGDGRRGSIPRVDQRRRSSAVRTPIMEQGAFAAKSTGASASPTSRRLSSNSVASSHGDIESRRSSTVPEAPDEEDAGNNMPRIVESKATGIASRRKTLPSVMTPASRNRDRTSTITNASSNADIRPPSPTRGKLIDDGKPLPPTPGDMKEVTTPMAGFPLGHLPEMGTKKAVAMAIAARLAAKAKAEEEAAAVKAKEVKPVPASKKSAAKEGVVVPPINVLIVEDNPINQNILSMFLRKKKIKHQSAKDGQEAVEKWRTGVFHLILMDIQLPVMDGIQATKAIRRLEKDNNIGVFPSTPSAEATSPLQFNPVPPTPLRSSVIIVALTASSLQTDRVNALAAGCNDFLTKPVSLNWLENKIIEWGCMQALIDFDGWRRWKTSDAQGPKAALEAKRAFQTGSDANAKSVASRLRIDRLVKPMRTPLTSMDPTTTTPRVTTARDTLLNNPQVPGANIPDIEIHNPTPQAEVIGTSTPESVSSERVGHTTLPERSSNTVLGENQSGVDTLHHELVEAKKQQEDAGQSDGGTPVVLPAGDVTPTPSSDMTKTPQNAINTARSTPTAEQVDSSEPSSHSSGSTTATSRPFPPHNPTTTVAPSPHQSIETISTDPTTTDAPEDDPVDDPHLHSQLPNPVLVDPETIGGEGADDGPQPNSEPSSGDTDSGPALRGPSVSMNVSGKGDKPLPPIPCT